MKKVVAVLLIALIFGVFASGCRKSIHDRAAEKMLEDMTEADVDISGDGENVTIETEDGTISAGDSMDWPGDRMADLPEPDATITGVVESGDGGCSVVFSGMSTADAEAYLVSVKSLGYTENAMNMNDDESLWYVGATQDGATVTFTYTNETGDGMIAYATASGE